MRRLLLSASLAFALCPGAASAEDPCTGALAFNPGNLSCAPASERYWSERPHLSQKEGLVTPLFSLFDDAGRDYADLTFMMKGIPGVSLPNLDGPVGFKWTFHFATGG